MKKKVLKELEVEVQVCNICEKEIEQEPWERTRERIQIIRYLFKTEDFHAHESCMNQTIRNSFEKFI